MKIHEIVDVNYLIYLFNNYNKNFKKVLVNFNEKRNLERTRKSYIEELTDYLC